MKAARHLFHVRLTVRAIAGHNISATSAMVARIGVLVGAAKSRNAMQSGFFAALVCTFMGDRAGGAARPAGAPSVRQRLFRSPTRLASGGRFQTATGAHA